MNKRSSKRDYRDYMLDIDDSVKKIQEFVSGFSLNDSKNDKKTIYAVVRAIEIIGEAVKNIPAKVKHGYKDVQWKKMADMRDKLIHEYFGVNIEVVWKTIQEDMPVLKGEVSKIVYELRIKKLL